MSYPKKLLRLRPTHGLAFDVPACEVGPDFWTAGSNVVFANGYTSRVGGYREAYSQNTVNPVYHLLNVRAPGGVTESNFWLVHGASTVYALETSNINNVTGAALSAVSKAWEWSSTLLNNIPCFNNGRDAPRYWAGDVGTPAVALPGWPAGTICKSLVAFKFHLFALDIDGPSGHFESQILWSDAAAPGDVPATWTASATNEAGDTLASDTPGPCMVGVPLQDTLLVFKRSSLYGINYIGGEEVFQLRLLDGARGALTRHSAVDVGGKAFVVTDGDVCLTDGTNWHSVAQGRVRQRIFSQIDFDNYESLFVVFDRARGKVRIYYPLAGSSFCNECIEYDLADDTFAVLTCTDVTCAAVGVVNDTAVDETWDADADTWDSDTSAWNAANFSLATEQLVVGFNSDVLRLENSGDAVALDAYVSREDLTMGEPERFKYVRRVHPRLAPSSGTVYVRVGARDTLGASITWDAEQTLVEGDAFVNVGIMGRYISVSVRGQDDDEWRLTGIDMEYEIRGYL